MNNSEYIEFTFTTKLELANFVQLFNQIKHIHNSQEEYQVTAILSLIPESVLDFFNTVSKKDSWTIKNLIQFVIEDLDVHYLSITEKAHNMARLEFEANAYPYGGPASLIILLKSYGLHPFKVDEGADRYSIQWTSENEFTLQLIEHE